ncbi:MAG: OprD family outer membrane porin [Epsilonproteobacteria bacterium]|nr:OprD family outer membrane porin [Campylobacterota bacterium]
MKITNLSLAAIAAVGMMSVANAEVTSELSGNAKIWYETADKDISGSDGLFHQSTASGQAAVSVEAKGNAGALGYGLKYTAVDTLGLENNLVSALRATKGAADPFGTAHWAEKAFITYKMGNTLAKIGRQHLDTPLAFTEKWNVSANSFDAAVLVNSDIENVTLIGAYVGRGNGGNGVGAAGLPGFSTVQANGNFDTFGADGAYVAAALIKPADNMGVNAWYYNVQKIADAMWLDANYAVAGVNLGAIYAQMMPKGEGEDTPAFAVKAGSKIGPVDVFAAYSSVDEDGALPVANVATGFKKTKLPTAGVYNDGVIVAQPGSDAFKIKAGMPVGPVKVTAQYISNSNDKNQGVEADEIDLIIGTKIADVNVKALYINRDFGAKDSVDHQNIRVIAGIDF